MYKEFSYVDHRPYPLPRTPWFMTQVWEDAFFFHFAVATRLAASYIPQGLEMDTYEGTAWLSVVPFRVSGTRVRGIPRIPAVSSYLELNVRTYVIGEGYAGVYFFSLDADSLGAVIGAKALTGLRYKYAAMNYQEESGIYRLDSRRIGTRKGEYEWNSSSKFGDRLYECLPGTLEHWLTERYCLFSEKGNELYRGDIHHEKWKVADASAVLQHNSMHPLIEGEEPVLSHYSPGVRAFFFPLKKLKVK